MEDRLLLILLWVVLLFMLILSWTRVYIQEKSDRYNDSRIANHVAAGRIASQRQMMIEEVRQKVLNGGFSSWQKASATMTVLFADETNHLRLTYPELTDIDICVLQLLAIGLDNQEILTFLDMSKRTFYKRRQLIAKRVGLMASQLDQFAYASFG